MAMDMMKSQIPNKPGLWEKLTPNFPPGCKPIIISDDCYPALNGNNVTLGVQPIQRITLTGIVVDSKETEYDLMSSAPDSARLSSCIPSKSAVLMAVSITDIWRSDARALYGLKANSLPNFAMLYGPNTS